ncbi:MAG: primosomal protein N' [Saprospiraceae bacterium]|nr:primosomal protein N' [Saprospiraceae bacterium]
MSETPNSLFAEVIVPLAVEGTFSYIIPEDLMDKVQPGMRVEVEFGKSKKYAAIVHRISNTTTWQKIKPILDVLDEKPILSKKQLQFWEWMSEYYLCSLSDIMQATLPNFFRLSSETLIVKSDIEYQNLQLSDDEFLVLEALDLRNQISIFDAQLILQKKNVIRLIKSMMDMGLLQIMENLKEQKDIPKTKWIRLHSELRNSNQLLNERLNEIQKSENQTRLIINYLQNKKDYSWIRKNELVKKSDVNSTVADALIKKNIFEEIILDKYRYPETEKTISIVTLSQEQEKAKDEIKTSWESHDCCLLHGITGSGKTHIYISLIKETIASGRQVLFLLPEIALTSQLVLRLKKFFPEELLEYHSGVSMNNRAAIWSACLNNHPLIVGARSSVLLPFQNLGLIIVDEEHDASYKQSDPSPRYNARDAAILLAKDHHAKILLGTATPSLESFYNAAQSKYGYVNLSKRFGDSVLPEIKLIPIREATKFNRIKGHFTDDLLDEIKAQLALKKQILVFRNRRGYSPVIQCSNCNWEAQCDQCDIHLTVHKNSHALKCHICGIKKPIPTKCPQCSQNTLRMLGFGTEKIEEELNEFIKDTKIKRFDLDSARGKISQTQILEDFQDGEIQILVGTQMLSKGLDFENVSLVGVLNADQILFYPDFRAQERGFQLLTQLSGRSGRRGQIGQVIIQAHNTQHPVLKEVIQHDYNAFYKREIFEREKFGYPPIVRLIRIELRHRNIDTLIQASDHYSGRLRAKLGKRILGPAEPTVSKIKGSYAREMYIKLEKNQDLILKTKILLKEISQRILQEDTWKSLRIIIDVDPY